MRTGLLSIKQGKGKNKKDWGVRGVVREEVGGEGEAQECRGLEAGWGAACFDRSS